MVGGSGYLRWSHQDPPLSLHHRRYAHAFRAIRSSGFRLSRRSTTLPRGSSAETSSGTPAGTSREAMLPCTYVRPVFSPYSSTLLGRTSTVAQSPFQPPLTCTSLERHWAVPAGCGCSHGTTLRCGCRPALHATWHAAEATSRVARLATGCTACHAMLCCTSCCKLYATWL
jgi:hypothetical protein